MSDKLTLADDNTNAPLNITPRSTAPSSPNTNSIYLDDGTNTKSGNLGFRLYNGSAWEDLNGSVKNNFAASAAPTTGDDTNDGYAVGSRWIDTTNDKAYVCLDATASAAVWTETTQSGGGGGGSGLYSAYIHIRDEKTAGTQGGTFTSGSFQTRDLNVIKTDTDGDASITKLAFNSGSTEPSVGDTISGATSGATATVFEVDVSSGSFGGGDAAGDIWLTNQSGTFQSENLDNDTTTDTNVATISGDSTLNQVRLKAGTYESDGSKGPARKAVGDHVTRLQDVTNTTTLLEGQQSRTTVDTTSFSTLNGQFTLSANATLEMQHRCDNTVNTVGFGAATGWQTEVYTELILRKVS